MVTGGHDSVVNVNATRTKRRLAHAIALRYYTRDTRSRAIVTPWLVATSGNDTLNFALTKCTVNNNWYGENCRCRHLSLSTVSE